MIKFTTEEISLCKQIAEKYRKETKHGDWYISYDGVIKLKALHQKGYRNDECILLWTISDCLEFLRERGYYLTVFVEDENRDFLINISLRDKNGNLYGDIKFLSSKTPLEACLKAVLAVLEEGK